jgi:hypothetical protein
MNFSTAKNELRAKSYGSEYKEGETRKKKAVNCIECQLRKRYSMYTVLNQYVPHIFWKTRKSSYVMENAQETVDS